MQQKVSKVDSCIKLFIYLLFCFTVAMSILVGDYLSVAIVYVLALLGMTYEIYTYERDVEQGTGIAWPILLSSISCASTLLPSIAIHQFFVGEYLVSFLAVCVIVAGIIVAGMYLYIYSIDMEVRHTLST